MIRCPYCDAEAALVGGDVIYPHRPDLHGRRFYMCAPCQAWVGCHEGTRNPLGRLANAELRAAKMAAHRAFDPLWRGKERRVRGAMYRWLASELGIGASDCHIGLFDVEQCLRVVEIVQRKQECVA